VVGASAGGVDEAAGDAGNEELVLDLELDDVVEFLLTVCEHRVELLGLGDGAREAIKDEPGARKDASVSVFPRGGGEVSAATSCRAIERQFKKIGRRGNQLTRACSRRCSRAGP
jgi:hypothetical protein